MIDIPIFPGLGTVVNCAAIIIGGLSGLAIGRFINEKLQQTLQISCAIAVIFIGIGGTLTKMLRVGADGSLEMTGAMMMIASLTIGGLIGEVIDIDGKFERFGEWLKVRTGNEGDNRFLDGFVTASLTFCIGAMSILGPINDALLGDCTVLYMKSVLDLVLVTVMAASMGKGCVFSSVSVGLFQGAVTIFAGLLEPLMTPAALANLSYVGNMLIFCVGINLMFGNKIRVANLLPALVVAAAQA